MSVWDACGAAEDTLQTAAEIIEYQDTKTTLQLVHVCEINTAVETVFR